MATVAELMRIQNEFLAAIASNGGHTEMRAMRDNMRPHDAVRLLHQILSGYDENGDCFCPWGT